MPAILNVRAARNVAWAPTINLAYSGPQLPLTGAFVSMQVRLYPGQPGGPLLSFEAINFADEALAKGRVLRLFPVADQVDLETMPTGLNKPEAGEADRFSYDIVITYADGAQDRAAAGYFYLEPGVTV